MDKKELIEKLLQTDEEISLLSNSDFKVDVIIAGGSALIIRDIIFRQTPDIDVIGLYKGMEFIFNKYNINSRVNAFSDNLAENYEDRIEKLDLKTKSLTFYTLGLEDLFLMKLYSDRKKDYLDITNDNFLSQINWDLIDKIIADGELDNTFNEKKYRSFLQKYENFKKEFKR